MIFSYLLNMQSHPSWVCGLKHAIHLISCHYWCHTLRGCVDWNSNNVLLDYSSKVTPFVGVWIETILSLVSWFIFSSHPSWVCGLKHQSFCCWFWWWMSHPSWVCGLKHQKSINMANYQKSHPSWVCGLKRYAIYLAFERIGSHPSWVCGLKQDRKEAIEAGRASHPSWVCGLKPEKECTHEMPGGHTLRGCVDWNCKLIDLRKAAKSHTLRGCVDWNTA